MFEDARDPRWPEGLELHRGLLPPERQALLLRQVEAVIEAAPPFSPQTRWGKPMTVRMTSAGRLGWYSDRRGYRYIDKHPSGTPWPPVPAVALELWRLVTGLEREPDCCLVNLYKPEARMGLHQDRDEGDFRFPVVSISLGDDGQFRIGGLSREDPTRSIWLSSGDVVVLGGEARLAFHGIDRIRRSPGSPLSGRGRINLTLRAVAL